MRTHLRAEIIYPLAGPDLDGIMLPEYRHITLRDLLTQRSGIASDVLGDPQVMQKVDGFAKTFPGSPLESRKACVRSLLSEKARSSQNGEFAYSNANYVIAGHMVETMAGHSWEDLIRKRLFEPLGMTTAGFGPPGKVGLVDQPHGHLADARPVRPGNRDADNPELYGPSGLVHCSVLDWAKFAAIHATQGESHPGLLEAGSFAVLHAPVKLATDSKIEAIAPGATGYAMGWFAFPGTVLTHSGTNLRWFAVSAVIPKDRLSVLVACNQGGDDPEKCCLKVLQELIKNYNGIRAGK